MKRRTFNKFSSHYMKIGLLSVLFRFPHRETAAHVRVSAVSIYVLIGETMSLYLIKMCIYNYVDLSCNVTKSIFLSI